MGEFCSFPPITLNPRPSSVFGSSTTLGWAWPSLAANAATVAYKYSKNVKYFGTLKLSREITFAITLAVAEALISGFP